MRSIFAVLAGLVTTVVLSIGADALMHAAGVYPPAGQPMRDRLLLLASVYRGVFGVAGGYVTARLAPRAPIGHALVLGLIGLALSVMGAVIMWEQSPGWYPISLAVLAVPYAWLGGRLARRPLAR